MKDRILFPLLGLLLAIAVGVCASVLLEKCLVDSEPETKIESGFRFPFSLGESSDE